MIVVGVGCGPGMLTEDAIVHIRMAKVVYGSERALDLAVAYISPMCEVHHIEDYSNLANLPDDAVLLSTGDPMLAGLGHLGKKVVPGISSMQYAFSRLRIPLTRAVVVDAHGKDERSARLEILDELSRGKVPFVLTEPGFDLAALSRMIVDKGIGCKIALCENLGYSDESISIGDAENPPSISSKLYSLVLMSGD
ncbi:MAG: cobalt-precorrin-7 (C(5))-methyltransferase [Methanomassiliicoccales archaeon]|jgi:cobalt-precorrin-7 (C5)-methyltransferase